MGLFKNLFGSKKDDSVTGSAKVEPRHVTGDEFDAVVLQSEIPAVVDFLGGVVRPVPRHRAVGRQSRRRIRGQGAGDKTQRRRLP